MSGLFDKTTQGLGAAINFRLLRNNVTSSNIANAETPGFKAKKMDFEEALSRALDTEGMADMHADHVDHFAVGRGGTSGVRVEVYDNPDINKTNDGNTVDLEREMSELTENSIMYRAALELINKKLGAMRYAVTEGNR
jgi:flagellar basal-body rod protein FlgB